MTGMIPMTIPILIAGENEDARAYASAAERRRLSLSQVKDTGTKG